MYGKLTLCLLFLFCAACVTTGSNGGAQNEGGNGQTVFSVSPAKSKIYRNAILLSWDGVQRNHLKECLYRKELPNLAKLIEEGTITEIYLANKTDTKCGHAIMNTGYGPDTTGVFSNRVFKPIPGGYTIYERAEKHFGKDNIVTIMLTGKANHVGSKGPGTEKTRKQLRGVDGTQGLEHQGQPFHISKKGIDVWDGDKARPATEVGPLAMKYLEENKDRKFLFFYHFSDPDHAGHARGENSKKYNNAIIICDTWLGKIVAKLKEYGIYDETAIFVNSDHGFDEGGYGHAQAPYVFLATNVHKKLRWGLQYDVAPTVLEAIGIDSSKFEPPLWGTPLTKNRAQWMPLTSEPEKQVQKPKPKRKVQQQRKKRQQQNRAKRKKQQQQNPAKPKPNPKPEPDTGPPPKPAAK
ncbi:MAG: hypothetical protein E3J72_16890 [Planctomycetota bacterium]|nr:MAG: hypothetical protein E3J72_16890 [Planctomycetota bacterium]